MLRRDGLRAPEAEEWPALRAAANRVFRPDGGDLFADSPLLFDPGNRTNLRVLVRGGEIVSHAGLFLCGARAGDTTLRVACLGAVFTVPEHRGRGLATAVVAEQVDFAHRQADLLLVSGDGPLYRQFGLDRTPAMRRYPIAGNAIDAAGVRLRLYQAGDLPAVTALYAGEPIGFVRSPAAWQRLLAAGRLMDAPAEVVIVLRDERVVAYAVIQKRHRKSGAESPGAVGPRTRRALELAGDRDALLACLGQAADELLVPAYDTLSTTTAEQLGWIGTLHQLPISAAFSAPPSSLEPAAERIIPWYGLNYL